MTYASSRKSKKAPRVNVDAVTLEQREDPRFFGLRPGEAQRGIPAPFALEQCRCSRFRSEAGTRQERFAAVRARIAPSATDRDARSAGSACCTGVADREKAVGDDLQPRQGRGDGVRVGPAHCRPGELHLRKRG